MRHVDVLGDSSVSYPCSLQLADTREPRYDARCCNTQTFTGHIPVAPVILLVMSTRAHVLAILPAFSDGSTEILLIPL